MLKSFSIAPFFVLNFMVVSFFLGAQSLEIHTTESQLNPLLPSGSGMAIVKERIFVVGDDTPFLFELDSNFSIVNKWEIAPYDTLIHNRLPKNIKPDYEAMEALGDSALLIFASGSSAMVRDRVVLVQFIDHTPVFKNASATPFFTYLKKHPSMMGAELNLEAVTLLGENVFLFNRGRNLIFQCNLDTLLLHFFQNQPIPKVEVFSFKLPEIKGIPSGFSGATRSSDESCIWFTASVEASKNAYDDGRVLGSFIGVILLENGQLQETIYAIQQFPGAVQKLESIVLKKQVGNGSFQIYLVADNDDGTSIFTKAQLKLLLD